MGFENKRGVSQLAVNRENFKKCFSKLPSWTCSTCCNGTLRVIQDTKKVIETGPSRIAHAHEAWDPDWIEERFCQFMECSNSLCEEIYVVSGRTSNYFHQFYEPNGEVGHAIIQSLCPDWITPPPAVFVAPDKAPEELKNSLFSAFKLLWSDHEASANRLRICIELLLNDVGIPSTVKSQDGSEKPIKLHQRIEEYKKIDEKGAEFLLAIKWIGNSGSHAQDEKISRDDMLDLFEITDHILDVIYSGKIKRLEEVAKAINAAKGIPKLDTQYR